LLAISVAVLQISGFCHVDVLKLIFLVVIEVAVLPSASVVLTLFLRLFFALFLGM
jgi:hypothetical protein